LAAYDSRLITPPTEEEEIYPYRRVWPSIALEVGIFVGITIILFLAVRFVNLPADVMTPLNLLLVGLPVGLWLIFSWWRERLVPEPRRNLLAVVVIAWLAANGVGAPVITDIFQVERWLPLENAINRMVGYAFTVGLVQAVIVYLVLRYTVWSHNFRIRLDGVAYGAACAVGYATALNIQFVQTTPAPPDITAMNIFGNTALLLCSGIIIGYGLAEIGFNLHPFPLLLTITLAFAALLTGIAIPLIAGFTNTAISAENPISDVSPIQGFLFVTALLVVVSFIFNFLFNAADVHPAEASAEDAESLTQ
jgi:hypothetical protein